MPEISGIIQNYLEGQIKTIAGEPVIQSKTITENGTYTAPEGVDGFSPVVVNVPSQEPNIQERVFASNGTFNPPEGVDGYAPVIIDVPMKEEITLNATMNGTYTPSEGRVYNNVIVNVPLPQNAYLLKSVPNLPQAIASFSDGADAPLKELKVTIEPQQEGSGDPSPTNVRPISGWDVANITKTGKNIWNMNSRSFQLYSKISVGKTLYLMQNSTNTFSLYYGYTDGTEGSVSLSPNTKASLNVVKPLTYMLISQGAYDVLVYQNKYIMLSLTDFTEMIPYNATTYTIDLDGTRYGGEVDLVNGIVTPAPYYASYNGETLTGEWISDRDKYEVGATPTIGAQVVNIGASGTPVSILPTAVKSLLGSNNVWADTGDITDAEYFSKEV